ncbi:MAG: phosphodiesterase [Paludibacteraceae bacterium]|nr:phosphodiesterase [Paludibacteraceae bacterium]
MKYLIVSDIHGSLPRLNTVLDIFRQEKCDMLLLLGDVLNYGPRNSIPEGIDPKGIADALNQMADKIVAVRGNCDSEVDQMLLSFPIMADYTIVVERGKRIFLTHGHKHTAESFPSSSFDVFISGHTHLWLLDSTADGKVVCNTGSITFPKGGNVPTFAILDNGVLSIRNLDNKILKQVEV